MTSGYFWLKAWIWDWIPSYVPSQPHTVRVPLWAAARGAAVKPRVGASAPAAANAEPASNCLREIPMVWSSSYGISASDPRLSSSSCPGRLAVWPSGRLIVLQRRAQHLVDRFDDLCHVQIRQIRTDIEMDSPPQEIERPRAHVR